MGNDPYAGLGAPVTDAAPPAQNGGDPYAGLGQSVLAHDITGKNGRVYRVLLNSEDQRSQVEQAINARIDAGDADLKGKLDLPFPAEVHHPAQAAPPPAPDPASGRFTAGAREFANGATAGFMDKIAAAADAVIPLDALTGADVHSVWDGSSFGDAYRHNLGLQQGLTNADDAAYPGQSLALNATGAVVSPVAKGAEAVAGLKTGTTLFARGVRALAPDAVYGAAYGAGSSNADTAGGVARDTLIGGGAGLVGSALGQGAVRGGSTLIRGVSNAPAKLLTREGVTPTVGQALGGAAQRFEDKLTSVPILGDLINARRAQGLAQFGRVPLNRALKPLGEKLPPDVTGSEALQYTQDAFDNAYDQARAGMHFARDPQFDKELADLTTRATGKGVDSLSPQYASQLQGIIDHSLTRIDANGHMDGSTLKDLVSSIRGKAAKFTSGNNPAEAVEFGAALRDLATVIDQTARRSPGTSPEATALMRRADSGYSSLVQAQNAAKLRGGDAGTFTPAQFDRAVQNSDRSVRNNAYSRGTVANQDLASAGREVLSASVPNSGTADRYLNWKMLAGLAGAGELDAHGHPYLAAPLAAGTIASMAYTPAGHRLISKILVGPRSQVVEDMVRRGQRALMPIGGSMGTVAAAQYAAPK